MFQFTRNDGLLCSIACSVASVVRFSNSVPVEYRHKNCDSFTVSSTRFTQAHWRLVGYNT